MFTKSLAGDCLEPWAFALVTQEMKGHRKVLNQYMKLLNELVGEYNP